MALVVKERIKETTATSGTGTLTLSGAVNGFRPFSDLGNNNTTFYCITDDNNNTFEVGLGTYNANTLTRDTVFQTSAGNTTKINFGSGNKEVFVTYVAEKSVHKDANGDIVTSGKILYSNVYSQTSDLPSASTYHGMFAHVHATGKGYFAHAGQWVELANASDLSSYLLSSSVSSYGATLIDDADAPTARTTLGLGTMAVETASDYLTTSSASSTYLTQSSASSTYLTQSNASSTYAPLSGSTFTGNIILPQTGVLAFNSTSDEYIQGGSSSLYLGVDNAYMMHLDGSNDKINFQLSGSVNGDIHYNTNDSFALESTSYLSLKSNVSSTTRGIYFSNTYFKPYNADNGALDLGTSSAKWKDLHLSGNGYAPTFHAQIFRSTDNTAKYLHPNSESQLVALSLDGGTSNNSNDATLFVSATDNSDWGIKVDKYRGGATDYGIRIDVANSASTSALQILGNDAQVFRVAGDGGVYGAHFYDNANSSYYVDPASTSLVNVLFTAGTLSVNTTNTLSSVGQLGIYSSANPYISFHNGTYDRTAYIMESGGAFYLWEATFTEMSGQCRAPIFYDSNNTSYYVDPASDSQIYRLVATDRIQGQTYIEALNYLSSPIMYDYNSTGYYCDPSSTSNLNYVSVQTDLYLGRALNLNIGGGGASGGTSGQVLTSQGANSSPQWTDPSGGGAWEEVSSTALTGTGTSSTIRNFSSLTADTLYRFTFSKFYWVGNADMIAIKLSQDGGSSWKNMYGVKWRRQSWMTMNYSSNQPQTQDRADLQQRSIPTEAKYGHWCQVYVHTVTNGGAWVWSRTFGKTNSYDNNETGFRGGVYGEDGTVNYVRLQPGNYYSSSYSSQGMRGHLRVEKWST